jgi:hypothetical protein
MKQNPESQESRRRRVYLLTCWQERDELAGTVGWRFRLESPQTGRHRIFASLEDTMKAIETEILPGALSR